VELDFHHASQHLWAIAYELFGEGTAEAAAWGLPLLRRLKHGGEARVLRTLEALRQFHSEHLVQEQAHGRSGG
jgi:hypothetical protein